MRKNGHEATRTLSLSGVIQLAVNGNSPREDRENFTGLKLKRRFSVLPVVFCFPVSTFQDKGFSDFEGRIRRG